MGLYQTVLGEVKVCSSEVLGHELAVCPPHHPQDHKHHLLVTAAKAALKHCTAHQLLPLGKHKVQCEAFLLAFQSLV